MIFKNDVFQKNGKASFFIEPSGLLQNSLLNLRIPPSKNFLIYH